MIAAGTWMEDLMKSMYYVTLQHGAAFAYEIERLWTTVASNKHNIIPILEFLISLGLQEIHSGVGCMPAHTCYAAAELM